MISGNDFYIHSLFFEKLQGLLCILSDPVLQDHGIEHMDPGRKDIFFCPDASVVSNPYYSSSLFQFLLQVLRDLSHKFLRSAYKNRACAFQADSSLFSF